MKVANCLYSKNETLGLNKKYTLRGRGKKFFLNNFCAVVHFTPSVFF